ncbi:class I SAM-dependent methyltransferase [Ketobacter sp.]
MVDEIIKRESGFCDCCKSEVTFESSQVWLRDYYLCKNCGCIPRERHLAYVIDQCVPNWEELVIHESSPVSRGVSKLLRDKCPNYIASQFWPKDKRSEINGVHNIDLESQSFASESFDLVVTQDVFEHLPRPDLAAKEIYRTLKAGGYFISTIPLVNKFSSTDRWANLVDGEVQFVGEPEFHGNPIDPKGSPVFWHYGYDLANELSRWAGFISMIVSNVIPGRGLEAEFNEVVVCRKGR